MNPPFVSAAHSHARAPGYAHALALAFGLALPALPALSAQTSEPTEPRDEWFRELDIEAAATQSDLILVTRVVSVKEIALPVGGKGERTMLQVQLRPVRVLKGVFAREELTLTSYDLGIYQSGDGLERIRSADLRLLFLGRSPSGYQNRNAAADVDRSLLLLRDAQDPLIGTVTTLLAVQSALDRQQRVTLLTEALRRTRGAAVVPLLNALARRAFLAAQHDATLGAIAPHLTDTSPAVRIAAGDTLRAVLAADYLEQRELRARAATELGAALQLNRRNVAAHVALIGAAGALGPAGRNVVASLSGDAPFAVQRAQIQALGRIGKDSAAFAPMLAGMPLDHPNADVVAVELARSNARSAATLIPQRARTKLAAGLSIEQEIHGTTPMPLSLAVATLLQLSELPLNARERLALATAAADLAARFPADDALLPLVTPLATLLDPGESRIRAIASRALIGIDAPSAADALRPHLREESDLGHKLRMAEFLGRHGIREGYPYAIEHMSEPHLLEQAIAALVAIGDARAVAESRRILETSNEATWNAAAIRVLGAMGERTVASRLLEIIDDWNDPLAPAALIALGDLGDPQAQPGIRRGLTARSEAIVVAAARAAGKLLKSSGAPAAELRDALGALVADSSATEQMRAAALESLVLIEDPRTNAVLASVVTDASLERTALMQRIETLLRERKVQLAPSQPSASN